MLSNLLNVNRTSGYRRLLKDQIIDDVDTIKIVDHTQHTFTYENADFIYMVQLSRYTDKCAKDIIRDDI
jgi:hypothetical protein